MDVYMLERLKKLLDLPSEANAAVVEACIIELKGKADELETLRRELAARMEAEEKMSPWKRWLLGSKTRG